MSVIATLVEPHRVTRIFFNCRNCVAKRADLFRIEQAIECSTALADPDEDDARDFYLISTW